MRSVSFGNAQFEQGTIYVGEVDTPWHFAVRGRPNVVTPTLASRCAWSRRAVIGQGKVSPTFVGLHSRSVAGGDYFLHLGATLLHGESHTLTTEVYTGEDAIPAEYADRLLTVLNERTAEWSTAATLRLDHSHWHQVDSTLRWYEVGVAVVVAVLALDLTTASDAEIAACALAAWGQNPLKVR